MLPKARAQVSCTRSSSIIPRLMSTGQMLGGRFRAEDVELSAAARLRQTAGLYTQFGGVANADARAQVTCRECRLGSGAPVARTRVLCRNDRGHFRHAGRQGFFRPPTWPRPILQEKLPAVEPSCGLLRLISGISNLQGAILRSATTDGVSHREMHGRWNNAAISSLLDFVPAQKFEGRTIMKQKWVLSCAAAALTLGLAVTTAQAARHHRHHHHGASQFAPGHLQRSPGGAKFFAPGHRQTSPGGAKFFAPGHRMR